MSHTTNPIWILPSVKSELSLVNSQEKYFDTIVFCYLSDAFLLGNYVNTCSELYQIRQCWISEFLMWITNYQVTIFLRFVCLFVCFLQYTVFFPFTLLLSLVFILYYNGKVFYHLLNSSRWTPLVLVMKKFPDKVLQKRQNFYARFSLILLIKQVITKRSWKRQFISPAFSQHFEVVGIFLVS